MDKGQYLRWVLIIGASVMPIYLSFQIYFAVDCGQQTTDNYRAWLAQGNKGTFTNMVDRCNMIHPIILIAIIPASPVVGVLSWWMTKPVNEQPNRKEDSQ